MIGSMKNLKMTTGGGNDDGEDEWIDFNGNEEGEFTET